MFYDGTIYHVLKTTPALLLAIKQHVARAVKGIDDPFERYEAIMEAAASLDLARFMVKHLVPTFAGVVTEANKDLLLKAVRTAQSDPERAMFIDKRDARRWDKAQEQAHVDA